MYEVRSDPSSARKRQESLPYFLWGKVNTRPCRGSKLSPTDKLAISHANDDPFCFARMQDTVMLASKVDGKLFDKHNSSNGAITAA